MSMKFRDVQIRDIEFQVVQKPVHKVYTTKYSALAEACSKLAENEAIAVPEALLGNDHYRTGLRAAALRRGFRLSTSHRNGMIYVWKRNNQEEKGTIAIVERREL